MSSHTLSFSQIPLEARMFTESLSSFAYLVIYHLNKEVSKNITSTLSNNFISENGFQKCLSLVSLPCNTESECKTWKSQWLCFAIMLFQQLCLCTSLKIQIKKGHGLGFACETLMSLMQKHICLQSSYIFPDFQLNICIQALVSVFSEKVWFQSYIFWERFT